VSLSSKTQDGVVSERRRQLDNPDEPIITESRKCIRHGSSLYVNCTKIGERLLQIEQADLVDVEVFEDRLVIRRAAE
jgi:hypothetical protein